jgi:RNA polymerase primary sigma factor
MNNVNPYTNEIASNPLLNSRQEVEAAQEVERLEIAYWEALLSYPPAFVSVVESLLTLKEIARDISRVRKLTRSTKDRVRLVANLARKLRILDVDRTYIENAYRAAQRLTGAFAEEIDLTVKVRVTDALKRYLVRVDHARAEQKEAKDRFASANLRLVISVARKYSRSGRRSITDLVQEGTLGLIKAIERFDYTLGYRFSTYATWWVRHEIVRAISDRDRTIRVPKGLLYLHNKVQRATQSIALCTGREATAEEIAREAKITLGQLAHANEYVPDASLSLDRSAFNNDDEGGTLLDLIASKTPTPYEALDTKTWANKVSAMLESLQPIEASILRWRFGFEGDDALSLREIGEHYSLSRERVNQIQYRALDKLRRALSDKDSIDLNTLS